MPGGLPQGLVACISNVCIRWQVPKAGVAGTGKRQGATYGVIQNSQQRVTCGLIASVIDQQSSPFSKAP